LFAVYYTGKSIIIFVKTKREYNKNKSDVKHIVKKWEMWSEKCVDMLISSKQLLIKSHFALHTSHINKERSNNYDKKYDWFR